MSRRIAFVSTIPADWGGSEELWSAAAKDLVNRGFEVDIYKDLRSQHHKKLLELVGLGSRLMTPNGYQLPVHRRAMNRILPFRFQSRALELLCRRIVESKPELVIISQGWNWDGLPWAQACQKSGIPYALISQAANIRGWPCDADIDEVSNAHLASVGSFHVAKRVLGRTEEMIGQRIPQGEVVRNPYNLSSNEPVPWPSADGSLRLACVGRFEFKDKGQDVLIRALGAAKWRERDLRVSFYGAGINKTGMQRLIDFCGAKGCEIRGHTESIESIWKEHHGLVLPSREEGLPLVVVEAMLCGRPCIVTDVVGNAELLEEGKTGYICPAPSAQLLDETLERVWINRSSLREMGMAASQSVRVKVPRDPGAVFADRLVALMDGVSPMKT